MAFTQKQLDEDELELANSRVAAGKAGSATSNNSGDVANLAYAKSKGWAPRSAGSLAGTMAGNSSPTTPIVTSPTAPAEQRTLGESTTPYNTINRELPSSSNSLLDFQSLLKDTMRASYGNKPTGDILSRYTDAGLSMTNPSNIGNAISTDTNQRVGRIMDVYSSTVDLIKQQEETRKQAASMGMDIAKNMLSTGFAAQLTGEDFESLKSGNISTDLMQKWGQYLQTNSVEDEKAPTTKEIGGKLYQYDSSTGSWGIAQGLEDVTFAEDDEPLSMDDLNKINVGLAAGEKLPYGTTKKQAMALGITPTPEKSVAQKQLEGNISSALDDIDVIRKKVTESLGRGKFFDREYKTAEKNLIDVIGRMRSGGAITEDESKTFKDLIPGLIQDDETSAFQLDKLQKMFEVIIGDTALTEIKQTRRFKNYDSFINSDDTTPDDIKELKELQQIIPNASKEDLFNEYKRQKGFNQPASSGATSSGNILATLDKYKKTQTFDTPTSYIKGRNYHGGVDYAIPKGTKIPLPDGEVIKVGYDAGNGKGWGNTVEIKDSAGNVWKYSHLDEMPFKVGQKTLGTQVKSGNTGYSTGPHLDLEVRNNGKLIDIWNMS